jgi:hypothetical protein
MSERFYMLVAGVIFLLIAVGHLLRIVFGVSFVVYGIQIPMWASVAAALIMGLLSYEGFHLARRHPPHV